MCFIPLRSDCVCLTLYNPYESLSSYFVCVHSQVLFVAKFIIPPHTNLPIFLSRNHTLSLNTIFIHPSAYSQTTRNLIQGSIKGTLGEPWRTLANLGEPWRTLANLGEPWRTLANLGKDESLILSLSLSLSLKLGEAWRGVLCCAVLASGVSQLAKAVFLIFLQRQCNL